MNILARALLLIGTLALIFAVGELVTRHFITAAFLANAKAHRESRDPEFATLPKFESSLELARPNIRGVYRGALHRTNDNGFRGPNFEPRTPEGVVRIVVAGDSVAMGNGVDEEETYARQLESRLAEVPGIQVETINTALAGATTELAIHRLARALGAYGADLLVYGFTINDIEGNDYIGASEDEKKDWRQSRKGPFGKTPSALLNLISRRISLLSAPRRHEDTWYAKEVRANYFDNPAAWEHMMEGFDRYRALADAYGVCAHVIVHTHLNHLDEGHAYLDIYAKVIAAARERGLTVSETWDAFEGRNGQSLWVSSFDAHPNAEAHAMLADVLARDLAALPPDCWTRLPPGE